MALAVRANLQGWHDLPTGLAEEAAQRFGGLGSFTAAEVAALVGTAFLGSEALILLGHEGATVPLQQAAEGHHTAVDWRTEGPLRVELSGRGPPDPASMFRGRPAYSLFWKGGMVGLTRAEGLW